MKVTRDVITDLLPAYSSGEASSDTRALVDEFLKNDTEFAALAKDAVAEDMLEVPSPELPPELEGTTLRRTKTLLWLRTLLLASAVFFTMIPLIPGFAGIPAKGIPLWVRPAALLWLAASVCWIGFVLTIRRLRSTRL